MALFPGDAERIEIWAEERYAELERGRLDAVLAALRSLAGVCEKVRHYAGCVERNRERWATRICRMGAVRGLGVGGGGLQDGDRDAAGAGRDALDGGGGKCDRQPALLQAERPLRAVLGGAGRANSMVTGKQRGAGSGEAAALEVRRDELRRQLAVIGDLRPESLGSRCLRPGNPNCRCWRQGELGHGPYWYLTCKMRAGR